MAPQGPLASAAGDRNVTVDPLGQMDATLKHAPRKGEALPRPGASFRNEPHRAQCGASGLRNRGLDRLAALWRRLTGQMMGYRPERHYMRGPGPKWHQRHSAMAAHSQNRSPAQDLVRGRANNLE